MNHFTRHYLQELYYRIIYIAINSLFVFTITYNYKQVLIYALLPKGITHFITTELTELFMSYIYACLMVTLFIINVVIIIQTYLFLKPGLYLCEANKYFRLITIYILIYILLYIISYPILIQMSWDFFSLYSKTFNSIEMNFELKVFEYIKHLQELAIILILFLITIMTYLFVKSKTTAKYRTITYMTILLLSAILTPPDPFSQLIISFILFILCEFKTIGYLISEQYCSLIR